MLDIKISNINNKEDLKNATQDYLALKAIHKILSEIIEELKTKMKAACKKFNSPFGKIDGTDGVNGSLTYFEQEKAEYNPEGIKKIFGEGVYGILVKPMVWNKDAAKAIIKNMSLTDEQKDEIYNSIEKIEKIRALPTTGGTFQVPFSGEEEDDYKSISPHIFRYLEILQNATEAVRLLSSDDEE